MKKIIELKLGVSLLTITFSMLGGINHAIAQTCTTPPSCDTLGYNKSASDCIGQPSLKCPFDNSKVFCGGTAVDCSSFTLSSCPSNASCSNCKDGATTYYKFSSCYTNYQWSGSRCVYVNPCPGYNSTLSGYQTSFVACNNSGTTYYKETACKSGKCKRTDCPNRDEGEYILEKNRCRCWDSVPCSGNE